jgi:beta-N-acetylhexosaminidase
MTLDLHSLPIEVKVGQLFFIGLTAPEIDAPTEALLQDVVPGGICLFARNIRERQQTREFLDRLREFSAIEPFLSVDQEGGLVDRLRRVLTPMPAASAIRTSDDACRLGAIVAESLRILGFNMDFAPVVDIINTERAKSTNGLFSRQFGSSAEETTALAGAFLAEIEKGGILGCLKHFPGLGASTVDSHEELPLVGISEQELARTDLAPYSRIKANAVMVAHAAYPGHRLQESDKSGKLIPSSLSRGFVTTLLRDELGFEGLAITDDLEMGAIIKNYGMAEACRMAVNAGIDMLAICADPARIREGYAAVLDAVRSGEIAEERLDRSLTRIAAVKRNLSRPLRFDAARLDGLSAEITELNARLAA